MKKFICLLAVLALVAGTPSQAQKKDQTELPNELYVSYGIGSIYSFTKPITHNDDFSTSGYVAENPDYMSSWGSIIFGYNRFLNRVISVGFQGSYGYFNYSTKLLVEYGGVKWGSIEHNENLLSGMAKINFNYYQSPILRVYSGIGIGITVDLANATLNGESQSFRKIYPAGQLTLVGVRVGRTVGFFGEFGFGTNGIVLAGLSVQLR